ncbi:MAG: hypothetical protein KAJ19_17245, partial [Gammaproteobacteria bacterium]|nr:hypothetical protein [Gammaproteobacteria bacterium]
MDLHNYRKIKPSFTEANCRNCAAWWADPQELKVCKALRETHGKCGLFEIYEEIERKIVFKRVKNKHSNRSEDYDQ